MKLSFKQAHAWSLAVLGKAEELQDDLDQAVSLAGRNKPVLAAVHLRLGCALRSLGHLKMARQHWRAAVEVDPHGWTGKKAAGELQDIVAHAG